MGKKEKGKTPTEKKKATERKADVSGPSLTEKLLYLTAAVLVGIIAYLVNNNWRELKLLWLGGNENAVSFDLELNNAVDMKLRDQLDSAFLQLSKGKVKTAQTVFGTLWKEHPDSSRSVYGLALCLLKDAERRRDNKLLDQALELLYKTLNMQQTPGRLFAEVADRYKDSMVFRGNSRQLVKNLEGLRLREMQPEARVALFNSLGVGYLMTGKVERARNSFYQSLESSPEDGFAQAHLGFIIKTTDHKSAESIPYLAHGMKTDKRIQTDGRFYFHLGDAYYRTDQPEQARSLFEEGAARGLFPSALQRSLYNERELSARPWWTPQQTTYDKHIRLLEENWQLIRDEAVSLIDKQTGLFEPEVEDLKETGDWKQYTLYQRGRELKKNCARVPGTCKLIRQIPEATSCSRGQIKFSVMTGGTHVWAHCGPTNCRLRAHLGLVIPDGPRIRVGEETRTWREGSVLIFDDSFEHEVWHDGNQTRIVLIVDFWHPELSDKKRRTLPAI